jgi:hypothetical protein
MKRRYVIISTFVLVLLVASILAGIALAQSITQAHADNINLQAGSLWHFAEGRVGKGFREYFTVSNPTVSACTVQFEYFYVPDNGTTNSVKIVTKTVKAQSRFTESVNADLGISDRALTGVTNSAEQRQRVVSSWWRGRCTSPIFRV